MCWHTTQRLDISNCTAYLIFCIYIFLSYNHPENCSAHVLYALYILKSMLHFEPHCSFRPSSYKLHVFFLKGIFRKCLPHLTQRVRWAIVVVCLYSCVLHYFQDFFPPSYTLLGFSVISVKNARCQAMKKVTAW
jgi:hypothetical protein